MLDSQRWNIYCVDDLQCQTLTGEMSAVWMMDSVRLSQVKLLLCKWSRVRLSQVKCLLCEWCLTLTGEVFAVWMMGSVKTFTDEVFALWIIYSVRLSQVKCLLCEWWTVLHSHRWSVCCVTVISVNKHFNRKCNQPMNDGQCETLSLTGEMFAVWTECLWKHQDLVREMFCHVNGKLWRVLDCQNFAMQTGS